MANDLTMDFGFSGNGGEYRGTGWSEPEGTGTWMLGQQSLLVLTRPEASGDYRIEFDMGVLTGPGHPSQRFAVNVNGTAVGDFVLSDDSREHCILPWSVIGREPGLTLVLSHPDAWRPSELSGGEGDQREMSFFLHSARLSLHAAAPTAAPASTPVGTAAPRPAAPVPAAPAATTAPAAAAAAPARPVAAAPMPAAPKPVAVAPATPKPMAPTPAPAAAKGSAPPSAAPKVAPMPAAPKAAPTPAASVTAAPRPSTPAPSATPAPAPRPPVAQPPARVPAPATPPASATPSVPAVPPRPAVRVATPEPQPAAPAPEARVPWWKKLLG